MKNFLIAISLGFFISTAIIAQDSASTHQTAKTFIRQGDYSNAILVLNKSLQADPDNFEIKKDLAFAYYLHRDYVKALETAKPLADASNADIQSYQILGMVYKAIEERKECEKMYKIAIKKFPKSGVLHNEYGEMLWSKKDFAEAVKLWERGIEVEPNYSGNYYNAAKYYYFSLDKVWGIVYGELFVNLESYSKRTAEIRNLLLDGYKKLFADADMSKNQNTKNEFVRAFLETMKKNASVVSSGVTPESLVALRTRFILDWNTGTGNRLPYRLFDYHTQLLKAGMFDAYNQWIFGIAKDLAAFQVWTTTHTDEYNKFNTFQKNRVFKLPEGQYYQATAVK
ncbi:MAG: tetratricopeptide repeat protein [Chitinophagaceae bacterium]|nr:tetratricopeptide repeat protein [Chitinophagaceae bacterium]